MEGKCWYSSAAAVLSGAVHWQQGRTNHNSVLRCVSHRAARAGRCRAKYRCERDGCGGALAAAAVAEAPDVRRIWVCGDSTVTDQTANLPYAPGTSYCGWGQMLPAYLPDVCITNHAHSGLTTESFTSEGHWDIVKPRLRAGDICLYQFGHNDQKLAHLQAYGGYTDRLRTYIKEARTAGAVPVLVTPLARNSWKNAAHYNDFWQILLMQC